MKIILSLLLLLSHVGIHAQTMTSNTKKIELELSFSESINTAISLKFGKPQIYGIVSGGIIRFDNLSNSAIGLGIGTQRFYKKGWTNEIELLTYTMSKDGNFNGDLSILSQLRFTFGKQISSHYKAYCGPVVNLTILKNKDADGSFSNDIAPYSIWSNKKENSQINAWIGITGGIRF